MHTLFPNQVSLSLSLALSLSFSLFLLSLSRARSLSRSLSSPVVLPDRALCLPAFSLLIVNKSSYLSCLSPSLSLVDLAVC